jgi:hypothetical protein
MGPGVRRDDGVLLTLFLDNGHASAFSRLLRPRFAKRPLPQREGAVATFKRRRREDRVRAAPAVSRAKAEIETHTSIQVQRKQSGLPCAMVLRLTSSSPWRPGLFATITPKKLASQGLDTSVGVSGPHDFAVHDHSRSSGASFASTASHPAFRDVRNAPLVG